MSKVAMSAAALFSCVMVFGVEASAQKIGPAAAMPLAQVTVTEGASNLTSVSCGQSLSRSYTVKNVGGAALTSKFVFNGVDTAFSLAKGEEKKITVSGGTYDCSKSLSISVNIPNPTSTGLAATPLWSKKYEADKVTYEQFTTKVAGSDFHVAATASTCAAPVSLYFKYPAPSGSVPVKASIGSEQFSGTVNAGSAATFTSTAALDCNGTVQELGYTVGTTTGKLKATKVSFKA